MKLYFGQYGCYEEYYAIGETAEEVKKMLWKMYRFNCWNKPNKEDRETFEDEVYIQRIEVSSGAVYGFNTSDSGRVRKCKNDRLSDVKGVTVK